jgi:hypothetical protein
MTTYLRNFTQQCHHHSFCDPSFGYTLSLIPCHCWRKTITVVRYLSSLLPPKFHWPTHSNCYQRNEIVSCNIKQCTLTHKSVQAGPITFHRRRNIHALPVRPNWANWPLYLVLNIFMVLRLLRNCTATRLPSIFMAILKQLMFNSLFPLT